MFYIVLHLQWMPFQISKVSLILHTVWVHSFLNVKAGKEKTWKAWIYSNFVLPAPFFSVIWKGASLLNNLEHIFPIFPRSKSNIHLSDLCPAMQTPTLCIFLHRRNYKTMPSKAFIVCSPSRIIIVVDQWSSLLPALSLSLIIFLSRIIIVVDHLSFQDYHYRWSSLQISSAAKFRKG